MAEKTYGACEVEQRMQHLPASAEYGTCRHLGATLGPLFFLRGQQKRAAYRLHMAHGHSEIPTETANSSVGLNF